MLLVVTDDQRTGPMPAMPRTRRWLGRDGKQFTDAFVTTPQCCPSRASILTGRYAHNHGVEDNSKAGSLDQRSTIERYLDRAGYRTGAFGWPGDPAVFETDRDVDPTGLSDKPEYVSETGDVTYRDGPRIRTRQLRTLESVDDLMSSIHRTLLRLGELRNTLVFFTSDNGFLWGEHRLTGKADPFIQAIKVPLYMSWPRARIRAGSKDGGIVANVDIAPTILDAANLAPDTRFPMDGRSLLGRSRNRPYTTLNEFYRARGHQGMVPPWASLTARGYQYVEYYRSDGVTPAFRSYYDLVADPWELDNLLGDDDASNDPAPSRLATLSARLQAARRCSGTVGATACP